VREFNAACRVDTPFNPNVLDGRRTQGLAINKTNWDNPLDTPPFHAYHVTTGVTFTFGGLKISQKGEVEDLYGRIIPGLYAAGEMVGGLFFHNYASGDGPDYWRQSFSTCLFLPQRTCVWCREKRSSTRISPVAGVEGMRRSNSACAIAARSRRKSGPAGMATGWPHMIVNVTSDGLDASNRHRPVIGIKSYGEKADRKKAGLEQRP
jgi:hypothetical protein